MTNGMNPRLRVLSGGKGMVFEIVEGENLVGKGADCIVRLDFTEQVSTHHARIFWEGGVATIEDLKSTNGTLLGSLEEPLDLEPGITYTLSHGDSVVFADIACVFLCPPAGAEDPSGRTRRATAPAGQRHPDLSGSMRPHTSAISHFPADDQELIRSQLDSLMQGMTQLYSVINGGDMNASRTAPARFSQTGFSMMGETMRLDPSEAMRALDQHAPQTAGSQHQAPIPRPMLSSTTTQRVQGQTKDLSMIANQLPPDSRHPTNPGLLRHMAESPQEATLTGRDMLPLYSSHQMQTRDGRRGSLAGGSMPPPKVPTRPMSTTTVDMNRDNEHHAFGRFMLPEACILRILQHCPRVPVVLRVAALNKLFKRLSTHEALWSVLDISWNTITPDPICHRMTDGILKLLLDRWYRNLIRTVRLGGCAFVTDWTLQLLSRYCFDATVIDVHRHADVGPAITDAGMVELMRRTPQAQEINASWSMKLGDMTLGTIADSCSALTSLDMTGCALISDVSVIQLAHSYAGPRLKRLTLQSCELLTGDCVQAMAMRCTSLEMLNLGACERVRGAAIADLMVVCPYLTDIDFTQCHQLNDINLRKMAPHFTRIERLRLGFCRNVSEEGFRDVSRFCSRLKYADVRGIRKLSNMSIIKLSEVAVPMTHLDIRGCQGVSRETAATASRNLPKCDVLHSIIN